MEPLGPSERDFGSADEQRQQQQRHLNHSTDNFQHDSLSNFNQLNLTRPQLNTDNSHHFSYQSDSAGSSYQPQPTPHLPLYAQPSIADGQPQFGSWNQPGSGSIPEWMLQQGALHGGSSASGWSSMYTPPAPLYLPQPSTSQWAPGVDTQSSLSSSARLKPFIEKLYSILAQPGHFRDCLVWDEAGTCFIVSHANPRLLAQVLPDAFGHSNLHSFTRQLNIYGFTRCTSAELLTKLDVTSTSDYSGWRHPLFKRGDTASLHLLTPRPSRARQAKKEEKAAKEQEKLAGGPP